MHLTDDGLLAAAAALTAAQIGVADQSRFSREELAKMLARSIDVVASTHGAFQKRTSPSGMSAWDKLKA